MEGTDKKKDDIRIIKEKIKNEFHRQIKQIHPDSGKGTDYEASVVIEKYRKQIELIEKYEKTSPCLETYFLQESKISKHYVKLTQKRI